jgi:rare lipoprotein A
MRKSDKLWYFRRSTISPLLCALVLTGCEEGLTSIDSVTQTPTGNTVETVEVDVTAPEAFSITDMAIWDGRPTFGGVWIAYPDIEQPERVRIRNDAAGKVVIGALYKRERDFPGPKIELSADAALALGAQAGTPIELTIVALRRKTVKVEVEAPVEEIDMTRPLQRPIVKAAVVAPTPEPAQTPEPEPAAAPEPTATPIISTDIEEAVLPPVNGQGAYLQVATLQIKSRADAVISKLRTAGLNAEIRERETSTKILYRIIVGPAASPEALEIMKATVIELGYKDAIVLG